MKVMESIFKSLFCLALYVRLVATTVDSSSNSKRVDSPVASPRFVGNVTNVTVAIGREAVFSCNVHNLGHFKVGWVHWDTKKILTIQRTVITYDPRISTSGDLKSTFNLHISNVQEEDRGVYMCQVNTDPMISQKATLQVNVPPDIDSMRTSGDIDAKLGSSAKIDCNADGYPKPLIKWRREDGKLIKIRDESSGRIIKVEQFTGPSLVVHNVQPDDMGSYLCIADNGVPPIVSKRIFIYVQFEPKVTTKALVGAMENRQVALICETSAYPKAMVEWMRDGNVIMSNGAWDVIETEVSLSRKVKQLNIVKANKKAVGKYICQASNSIGIAEAQVQVYLIDAPKEELTTPYEIIYNSIEERNEPIPPSERGEEKGQNSNLKTVDTSDFFGTSDSKVDGTEYNHFNGKDSKNSNWLGSGSSFKALSHTRLIFGVSFLLLLPLY